MTDNALQNAPSGLGPLPIVVGVAGHRDLRPQDVDELKAAVKAQLSELMAKYPHTPIALLTALAEGADRLAAEVAFQMGVTVNVVMPMAQNLYELDWEQQSVAEFRRLLEAATAAGGYVFELPVVPGCNESALSSRGPERRLQYQAVGDYIAGNCHILMALWDGLNNGKPGGTWEVVKYKLEGDQPAFKQKKGILDSRDVGPVIHILTLRADGEAQGNAGVTRLLLPGSMAEAQSSFQKYFNTIFENFERFNSDCVAMRARSEEGKDKELRDLKDLSGTAQVPSGLKKLLEWKHAAGELAGYYKRKMTQGIITVFILVFCGVVSFELFAHTPDSACLGLLLYAAFFIASFFASFWCKRSSLQDRHQDYRALAEAMRVLFYWRVAGMPDNPTDYYLRKQRSELDWVRAAVQAWNIPLNSAWSGSAEEKSLRYVNDDWVKGQAAFYERAAKRDSKGARFIERTWSAVLVLAVGAAAVQVILECESHIAIVAIAVISLTAGLIVAYGEFRALPQQANQYARVGKIFAHGAELTENLINEGKLIEARALMLELGKEALAEHGDWLLLHRDRPFDVPYP